MEVDIISDLNDKLFSNSQTWDDLEGMDEEDLSSFLDISSNFNTEDFINQLPHDLQVPMLKNDALLGENLLGFGTMDDLHSDSSDSGIEFPKGFKMEPMSPSSSHCSDLSLDSLHSNLPMSAILEQSCDLLDHSHDLAATAAGSQYDAESLRAVEYLKQEIPNLTNIPMQNILSTVPHGDLSAVINVDDHNPLTPPLTPNNTVTIIRSSGASQTVPIASRPNGVALPNIIKVIMPQQQTLGKVTTSPAVAHVLSSKAKVLPKPPIVAGTGASKTLVFSQEEFAKLTSQKLLNIKTAGVNSMPLMTTSVHPYKSSGFKTQIAALPVVDGENKTMKRQQRMMKNRESACLSRKRKKEYLTTLEERLQEFNDENSKLKNENNTLKKAIVVLQTENSKLKNVVPSSVMKGSTVLLGILLLVSLNLGPLMNILRAPSLPGQLSYPSTELVHDSVHHGRTLMSYTDSDQFINLKNLQREWKMMKESLHLRRDDSPPDLSPGGATQRDWTSTSTSLMLAKQIEALTGPSTCPTYFNSTESQMLLNELRGWVKGHEAQLRKQQEDEVNRRRKKKKVVRAKKYGHHSSLRPDTDGRHLHDYQLGQDYGMQVFNQQEQGYYEFLKTLQPRNDTFYVVSFRQDHMLLPATAHNKTMRPRMTVIMPAMGLNESMSSPHDSIAMMQIDCEVTGTKLVNIHKSAVPQHMDPNVTSHSNPPMPNSYYDKRDEYLARQQRKNWN